jgi:hypothetical protein
MNGINLDRKLTPFHCFSSVKAPCACDVIAIFTEKNTSMTAGAPSYGRACILAPTSARRINMAIAGRAATAACSVLELEAFIDAAARALGRGGEGRG